jgi:predicted nucleic acid-binding protein
MIHLDTSFLIGALVPGSPEDRLVRSWLRAGEPLAASAIAWTEFLCGPLAGQEVNLAERLIASRSPFLDEDAELAARLFNETGRRRGTLADCMIAATALRERAAIATMNVPDFRRFVPFGLALAG